MAAAIQTLAVQVSLCHSLTLSALLVVLAARIQAQTRAMGLEAVVLQAMQETEGLEETASATEATGQAAAAAAATAWVTLEAELGCMASGQVVAEERRQMAAMATVAARNTATAAMAQVGTALGVLQAVVASCGVPLHQA